jgi:D-serine deaminase-like pyridoxal phosphate-dependent protein
MGQLPPSLTPFLTSPSPTDKHWSQALGDLDPLDVDVSLSWAPTPAFTLDIDAMKNNISEMHSWAKAHNLEIAPHGKTTMAPALWQWQLDEGATAITVANEFQLRVAHAHGIRRVLVANQLISPTGLAWLASQLGDDFDVTCWVDSLAAVEIMERILREHGATAPLGVCIELGPQQARAGVRSDTEAEILAAAVVRSPHLQLRGFSAFEGAISSDTDEHVLREVREFLTHLVDTFERLLPFVEVSDPILSAGGSLFFDLVAEAVQPLLARTPRARVILRSGATVVHDDGLYRLGSPKASRSGPILRPAAHVWSRVLSVPEPGLALLDAGKRDVAYDFALPEVQQLWRNGVRVGLGEAPIFRLADQHAFVRTDEMRVGDIVRLGISHPCTVFDKWRTALLVEGEGIPVVRGMISLFF